MGIESWTGLPPYCRRPLQKTQGNTYVSLYFLTYFPKFHCYHLILREFKTTLHWGWDIFLEGLFSPILPAG